MRAMPTGAVLCGSVPLPDAETVFSTVSGVLGDRVSRIPDGETGDRYNWILWQRPVFEGHPLIETVPPDHDATPAGWWNHYSHYRLRPGVDPAELRFDRVGYAEEAKRSYDVFALLKEKGIVPDHVRFQVCVPPPSAALLRFVALDSQPFVEPAYEERLLAEVDDICASIPHDQLTFQWDVAIEMAVWEGVTACWWDNPRAGVVERLTRLGNRVPATVELGFHLCYGDYQHRHWKEPDDAANLVAVAGALFAGVKRPVSWLHIPVPRDRHDVAYFEPLFDLRLPGGCEFYLGLVHMTDGVDGTRQRIVAAEKVVENFGVSTECGWGRRPEATIPDLLRLHAAVCDRII